MGSRPIITSPDFEPHTTGKHWRKNSKACKGFVGKGTLEGDQAGANRARSLRKLKWSIMSASWKPMGYTRSIHVVGSTIESHDSARSDGSCFNPATSMQAGPIV
jgi:hypothetical protein